MQKPLKHARIRTTLANAKHIELAVEDHELASERTTNSMTTALPTKPADSIISRVHEAKLPSKPKSWRRDALSSSYSSRFKMA